MADDRPIRIGGLADFSRSLRKMDRDLPKALRIAMNQAADIVIDDAVPRIPRRTGRAQASIKAKSTRTAVRVGAGSAKAPYYPWLDFGGRVGRKRSVHRPFYTDGRYLYPSYFRKRDSGEFAEALRRALIGVAISAGVEVDS